MRMEDCSVLLCSDGLAAMIMRKVAMLISCLRKVLDVVRAALVWMVTARDEGADTLLTSEELKRERVVITSGGYCTDYHGFALRSS